MCLKLSANEMLIQSSILCCDDIVAPNKPSKEGAPNYHQNSE
jgi:hypothetical protein